MAFGAAAIFGGALALSAGGPVEVQQSPPAPANITLEMLAREGYEVKAIQNAATRGLGYVVMMQRGGEVKTCLMRIERGTGGRPSKQSVCF